MSRDWFNLDIDRRKHQALKWLLYPDDVIPMWIADSDYRAAPAIHERLSNYAQSAIFGYQLAEHIDELNRATVNWLQRRYGWEIEPDWLVWIPGVMVAVNACVQVFSQNKVTVQTPNYPPILNLGKTHEMEMGLAPVLQSHSGWTLDLTKLEEILKERAGGLFVLTNPMNPGGSVYSSDDLNSIGRMCAEYDTLLCSDEVHCDLILDASKHIPAGSLESLSQRSVTIMSASKTFNIAGLATAYAVIPNESLRRRFYQHTVKQQFWVNPFGIQATIAAYTDCDDWYLAQLQHLRDNQQLLNEGIKNIAGISYQPASATYLAWINTSGLDTDDPHQYFLDRKVGLAAGVEFGDKDYLRLNFACPQSLLSEALQRMAN